MQELKSLGGIPKRELLYHILSALKIVDKNLKKFPEEIQLLNVEIKLSSNVTETSGFSIGALIGFEKSKVKEFSRLDVSKFDFTQVKKAKYVSSRYVWKELGANLTLQLGSDLMKRIGDHVIAARESGIMLKELKLNSSFSVTISDKLTLNFSFLSEAVKASASVGSAKKVSHEIIVSFGKQKADKAQVKT